jgi:hypothetical protein
VRSRKGKAAKVEFCSRFTFGVQSATITFGFALGAATPENSEVKSLHSDK